MLSPCIVGIGGDAQVDLAAAHGHLDAPVLRQAALGDVEPRHDLDARGDGGPHGRAAALDLVQHAVDAIAHAHAVLDAARRGCRRRCASTARAIRLLHEADDRRLAGHVLEALDIVVARRAVARLRNRAAGCPGCGITIEPFDGRLDVAGGGSNGAPQRPLETIAQSVGSIVVQRVRHGDGNGRAVVGDRQDGVAAQEGEAQRAGHHRLVGKVGGTHERIAEQARQRGRHGWFGDQAQPRQHQIETVSGAFLGATRTLRRYIVDRSMCDQIAGQGLDKGRAAGVGRYAHGVDGHLISPAHVMCGIDGAIYAYIVQPPDHGTIFTG